MNNKGKKAYRIGEIYDSIPKRTFDSHVQLASNDKFDYLFRDFYWETLHVHFKDGRNILVSHLDETDIDTILELLATNK